MAQALKEARREEEEAAQARERAAVQPAEQGPAGADLGPAEMELEAELEAEQGSAPALPPRPPASPGGEAASSQRLSILHRLHFSKKICTHYSQ